MDEIVNILLRLNRETEGSGMSFVYNQGADRLEIMAPYGRTTFLRLTRLYRPSTADVVRNAAFDTLLILTAASEKAAKVAAPYNHIVFPNGSFRIVAPGLALIHEASTASEQPQTRQVRLMGRTGVIAESLLQRGNQPWSVRELAEASRVSPGLAQRAIQRLEGEGLLASAGTGRDKTRTVANPRALAELWSQEEKQVQPTLRGFLYGATPEAVAQMIIDFYPNSAVGGSLAANRYAPTLTRVTPPIRIWAPSGFDPHVLESHGFQQTDEGANIELMTMKHDPWRVHRKADGLTTISSWRAWVEIAQAKGRVQELADALMKRLEDEWYGYV